MLTDATDQFRDAIAAAGLTAPDSIIADGELHRFASNGTRSDDAGWYVYHGNGVPAGGFGCWRAGISESWRANIGRRLTPAEVAAQSQRIEDARRKREAEQARLHAEARARAAERWRKAKPADPAHPYLVARTVRPHGIRQEGNVLLIPMRADGELHSLQTIAPDGDKRFLSGGRVAGCYLSIGKPDGVICIAEGYATGATIHEATGHAVAVAFYADNVPAVARALRGKWPDARIILCADDDYQTTGNPGLTKANNAARAVGGLVAIPDFGDDRSDKATDFNDLARHRGADAVEQAVANARVPEASEPQQEQSNAPAGDSGLCVLTLAELLTRQFPEREPILAPWLLTQSLTMIHAWRGIGKTHMALGVAYAVATGGKFLTWEAPRPRRVLYIDGEMPAAAIRDRLKAMVEADERDFDPAYLLIVTPDAQHGPMPDLATREGQDAIEEIAAQNGIELVIVDNISTLCRATGPENEAESWRGPQEWALRMRRAGRSVLFVHHSGKGGAQRGSSKREDTLDVVIKLQRPSDYQPEQDARFEIHFEKYRNGAGDDAKPIEARLEKDGAGRACWTWRSVEEGTYERVVALCDEGFKPRDIATELEINKSTVSRHLKRARSEGRIGGGKP